MSFDRQHVSACLAEIARLAADNEALVKENQELRNLTCFIDDERKSMQQACMLRPFFFISPQGPKFYPRAGVKLTPKDEFGPQG
jgi:hypothetical protein